MRHRLVKQKKNNIIQSNLKDSRNGYFTSPVVRTSEFSIFSIFFLNTRGFLADKLLLYIGHVVILYVSTERQSALGE